MEMFTSDSIDMKLLMRGFNDLEVDEEEKNERSSQSLDMNSDAYSSQGWVESDLKEINSLYQLRKSEDKERRPTIDGVEVAPRSDLSPPPATPAEEDVFDYGDYFDEGKGRRGRQSSRSPRNVLGRMSLGRMSCK
jgi:hypothetical protein